MTAHRPLIAARAALVCLVSLLAFGCEGIDRKHDARVADISPPDIDAPPPSARSDAARQNWPDLVENMMAARQAYLNTIVELERSYLVGGDTTRANWARRQRSLTEEVVVYPYLTSTAPEQRTEVAPRETISEADSIYQKALAIHNEVKLIPAAGALPHNKKKAREAMNLFKQVINRYPTSDKVDDCAFYVGEIYKEYLREDDPNDELAVRYYKWALQMNPKTEHPVRFQLAVVEDFRRHNRDAALELYHQVIDLNEAGNNSNARFAATRIEQLSDEDFSHLRPAHPRERPGSPEPKPDKTGPIDDREPVSTRSPRGGDRATEPDTQP